MFLKRSNYLSVPALAVTALVASSVFDALSKLQLAPVTIATQVVSIIAVVLGSVDKAKNYGALAGEHRKTGASFLALRDKVRLLLGAGDYESARVDEIIRDKATVTADAPSLPDKILKRVRDGKEDARALAR